MSHPWIWLNQPQHAAAVQAVAAVIGTVAAIFAGVFAAGAYKAALAQAQTAREQLDETKKAHAAETLRLEQAAEALKRRTRQEFERKRAEEEAIRPRFRPTPGFLTGGRIGVQLENVGGLGASNVVARSVRSGQQCGREAYVTSIGCFMISVDGEEFMSQGVHVEFDTEKGSHWLTLVRADRTESVVSVKSNYEPRE